MKNGILHVTRGQPALRTPAYSPNAVPLRYGVSVAFQVALGKAGLFSLVRRIEAPCIDFAAGADVIVFDKVAGIAAAPAFPITRGHEETHPETGEHQIIVKYPFLGGFVPLGARREDGSPHPHAGTGFAVGPLIGFPADLSDRIPGHRRNRRTHIELYQLAYDGATFSVARTDRLAFNELLPGWDIVNRGLSPGLPDGDDLLNGLVARRGEGDQFSGIARWQRGPEGWRPVSFQPVTPEDTSMEPSIVREADGSLLFSARCSAHGKGDATSFGIRVWHSADNGSTWRQVFAAPRTIASTPVVLSQAADGTPFVAANPYRSEVLNHAGKAVGVWSHRQQLDLWPLTADRTGLDAPIRIRDTNDFGPPPTERLWYADHPIAATVQLADGVPRSLLCYRIRPSQPGQGDCEQDTPHSGCYIEEVAVAGTPRPLWRF